MPEIVLMNFFSLNPGFYLTYFSLQTLRTDNEFFFVDLDAKLSKMAPEGWKEDPKRKKSDVPFNLFLRIKFFLDDINLIQYVLCYCGLKRGI